MSINRLKAIEKKASLPVNSLFPLSLALTESLMLLRKFQSGDTSCLNFNIIERQVMLFSASLCSIQLSDSDEDSADILYSFGEFSPDISFKTLLIDKFGEERFEEDSSGQLKEVTYFFDDFFSEILLIEKIISVDLNGAQIIRELSRSLSHIADHFDYAAEFLVDLL